MSMLYLCFSDCQVERGDGGVKGGGGQLSSKLGSVPTSKRGGVKSHDHHMHTVTVPWCDVPGCIHSLLVKCHNQ